MKKIICAAAVATAAVLAQAPADAFPAGPLTAAAIGKSAGMIGQVQPVGRRVVRVRPVVRPVVRPIVRPVVRPGVVVGPRIGYVHRPWRGRYWRPGLGWAVGSVVAVGVLTAAAAAAYAPPPPAAGLCWYYTDPTYRAGYWAECQ
jgi:hypothetical protein